MYKAALELQERIHFKLPPVDAAFDCLFPVKTLRAELSQGKTMDENSEWCRATEVLLADALARVGDLLEK